MKVPARFTAAVLGTAVIVIGCSSSSNNGSQSVPSCKGATASTGAGSAACSSCTQNSCGGQVSSAESACSAYIACYEGCQCSDTSCLTGCVTSKVDTTCGNALSPLSSCLSQNCSSQCNGTVGDGG